MAKTKRKTRARKDEGRLLEKLAISEAYRDAWYAVALERAEEMTKDPELCDRIDDAIIDVLEGMIAGLRARRRRGVKSSRGK
ncbi:MAG: hypothetical protein HY720_00365 [Planctomycetes bacterium]|nr:hypothetical protein [Planctomycetota bacterium]